MESKSIKRFKEELVKNLPFFPNNKETKEELLAQSITSVLLYYIHWASRLVPVSPRKVIIDPYVTQDSRWLSLKNQINTLLSKVRKGEDLSPYLSLKAHQKGYTPADRIKNGDANRGDDKDFLLNIMGFHHFHLDERITATGISERTNEVAFVRVTREKFHIVAIFDHSVFESDRVENNEMNAERARLWRIFDEFSTRGMAPGTVYAPSIITTSGHPLHIRDIASGYADVINQIDPKISDHDYVNGIYEETKLPKPKNNKLNWHINGLDLGLLDKNNQFFILRYGPA